MEEIKSDELAKFHKQKRRRRRIFLTVLTIIFITISVISIGKYYILNIKSSIKYNENSDINYGVNLIENEFYKTNHLGENVDVISSLIKDIDVGFKYNLNLSEEIEYTYSYKIVANIILKEKSKTNLIYSDEQVVINKELLEGKSRRLDILETMNINYNDYNNQINKLIEQYKLDNTESELSLSMKLNVVNKATGEKINKETNVMTIVIPLDTKTVEITVNENVKDSQGEIVIQLNESEDSKKYLTIGILAFILGLLAFVSLIRYISKTRSAEKMYENEIKKILFDYKSYVQKINTPIDYKSYKVIKIDTFAELMQMREDLQTPILMYTEKNNLKTIFMMIKDDMLFAYIISSKAIRNRLIEESKNKKKGNENEKN